MLVVRWKNILINWINCYNADTKETQQPVTKDALLSLITHLCNSFGLDESKSSILESNTVEEFILEKYPEFKFENGTVQTSTDDDIYLAASLLLYFVCVNSKDVGIKNRMCSRLSSQDQEVILKFSKSLMSCLPITCEVLKAAILESCGPDTPQILSSAAGATSTPPALRSLHGEVRRLRAALDAERFDRTYLQDELARTSERVNKLVKDKEQYQKQIQSLKAQVSCQCGDMEAQSQEVVADVAKGRQARQLAELEARLQDTRMQLDDALHERDTYKAKYDDLKVDRDKWLIFGQQENHKACSLAEELETERHTNSSLREMLSELQQHQKRNADSSSMLECDDPDISLRHNTSSCGEACTGVVEVQLEEARVQCAQLAHQLRTLEEEYRIYKQSSSNVEIDLTAEIAKQNDLISKLTKENKTLSDLKEKIAEALTSEIETLNNKMTNMKHTAEDMRKNNDKVINDKLKKIGQLQMENKKLQVTITDEKHKIENLEKEKEQIARHLTEEQDLKLKLQKKTKNQTIAFNELKHKLNTEIDKKVKEIDLLRQKSEELQNKCADEKTTFESTLRAMDDALKAENQKLSRKEDEYQKLMVELKDLKQKTAIQTNHLLEEIKHKCDDIQKLQEEKNNLNTEIEGYKIVIYNLETRVSAEVEHAQKLQDAFEREKQVLLSKVSETNQLLNGIRDQLSVTIESHKKEIAGLQNDYIVLQETTSKSKLMLEGLLKDKDGVIKEMGTKIRRVVETKEKEYKTLENEMSKKNQSLNQILEDTKQTTKKEINEKLNEIQQLQNEKQQLLVRLSGEEHKLSRLNDEKEDISSQLKEEVESKIKLQKEFENKIISLSTEITQQNLKLELLQAEIMDTDVKHESEKQILEDRVKNAKEVIEAVRQEVIQKETTNNRLQDLMKSFKERNDKLLKEIQEKNKEINLLQETNYKSNQENMDLIKELRQKLESEVLSLNKTNEEFESERVKLKNKILETEAILKDLESSTNTTIEDQRKEIQLIQGLQEILQQSTANKDLNFTEKLAEKDKVICTLKQQIECDAEVKETLTRKLTNVVSESNDKKKELEQKIAELAESKIQLKKQTGDITLLQNELSDEWNKLISLIREKDTICENFNQVQVIKESLLKENQKKDAVFNDVREAITKEIEKRDAQILHVKEELKTVQEQSIVDKSKLESQLNSVTMELSKLNEQLAVQEASNVQLLNNLKNKDKLLSERKAESLNSIQEKVAQIDKLQQENNLLTQTIKDNISVIENLHSSVNDKTQCYEKLKEEFESKTHKFIKDTAETEASLKNLMSESSKTSERYLGKIKTLQEENKALRDTMSDEQGELKTLMQLKDKLHHQLEEKHSTVVKLQNERDEQIAALNELKSLTTKEKEDNVSKLIIVQKELNELQEESACEKQRLETLLSENNSSYVEKLSTIETINIDLTNELQQQNLSHRELKQKYVNDVKKLNEEINVLKQEIKNLTLHLEDSKNVITEFELKLSNKLDEFQSLMQESEDKCAGHQNEITEMDAVLKDYKQKLATTVNQHQEDIRILQEEHKAICDHNANSKDAIINDLKEQLLNEVGLKESIKLDQENKVHALAAEVKEKDQMVKQSQETMELLKNDEIRNLHSECNKLRKENECELLKIAKERNAILEKLREHSSKCQIQKEIEAQAAVLAEHNAKLVNEIEKKTLEIAALTEELEMKDKNICVMQQELESLETKFLNEKCNFELVVKEKDVLIEEVKNKLNETNTGNDIINNKLKLKEDDFNVQKAELVNKLQAKLDYISIMEGDIKKVKEENQSAINELKQQIKQYEDLKLKEKHAYDSEILNLKADMSEKEAKFKNIAFKENEILQSQANEIQTLKQEKCILEQTISELNNCMSLLAKEKDMLSAQLSKEKSVSDEVEKGYQNQVKILNELKLELTKDIEEKVRCNVELLQVNEAHKTEIESLKQSIQKDIDRNQEQKVAFEIFKKDLEEKSEEVDKYNREFQHAVDEGKLNEAQIIKDKGVVIDQLNQELSKKESAYNNLKSNAASLTTFNEKMQNELREKDNEINLLQKENKKLIWTVGNKESGAISNNKNDLKDLQIQVNVLSSDLLKSSEEENTTISNLEKIIYDKNRNITALQTDITYLKALVADSENKLLDVSKELEVTKESYDQLSSQLKKSVHQKNEEIVELKKQISKMSITENRASQIIKVSAKYQAIILKRIAEIKTNTVLKELTNMGNAQTSYDADLRRSLSGGAITTEELENFLESTEKNLRRFSDKQAVLLKERDRYAELNRINESEAISLKKFITELSVHFKTFSSVKELYNQKLTKVVSLQRMVRREIHSSEGNIGDKAMTRLERAYSAVMQDLTETVLNMERWAERCVDRSISPEKLKQAFGGENPQLSTGSFQNTGLEVQLEEVQVSFKKVLEEVARARSSERVGEVPSTNVMEVRAEYEDKLNRMKAKMKELYKEQMWLVREQHRAEAAALEGALAAARGEAAAARRGYEEHVRRLTSELWAVGERFLVQKDEAEWLRRRQNSASLMSLQHTHSSGIGARGEQSERSRPPDSVSLHSLPAHATHSSHSTHKTPKAEGRFHMSDEEGEVFDNRWLQELHRSPPASPPPAERLSELRWRNSLCPPHLKSSYPTETQLHTNNPLHEEDIKSGRPSTCDVVPERRGRKEVGITAYKKPGPPTPSKNAGRLSATDSELRESLRPEGDAPLAPPRKTTTPSRFRAMFRSNRSETENTGTPQRRLSFFRSKK